jgi:hypothetical protein
VTGLTSPGVDEVESTLSSSQGRDFELAVTEAFRALGLRADHIEETQGESDVLVFAQYCEEPYGVVVECMAKEGAGQVGAEKVGQARSHFSRYLSKFRGAKAVFRCVVGRPSFSKDCIKDAKGTATKDPADVGVCLVTAEDLTILIHLNSIVPISQEDMREIFSRDGETHQSVKSLEAKQRSLIATYAAVLAMVDLETEELGRTVVRLDQQKLVGQTATLLRLRKLGRVPDEVISRAIVDLSSPLLDLVRTDGSTIKRTSHKIVERLQVMGKVGEQIAEQYNQINRDLRKL